MTHGRFVLIEATILNGQPIRAVSYLEPEPEANWDSGFALFASPPDRIGASDVMCLECAIDEWPDIGRALDLARKHGEAIRDGDEWTSPVRAANG